MARRAPTIERDGTRLTVVAPSAEEAMAAAGDAAPGFRTVSVDNVRRGGIAGFFATEMVRLVVETDPRPPGGLSMASADDLLASLCSSEGPFAGRLAVGLQRSLLTSTTEPPPAATTSAPVATGPPVTVLAAATQPAVPTTSGPTPTAVDVATSVDVAVADVPAAPDDTTTWSVPALRAIGLPDALVADIARRGPTDEVSWNVALLMALRTLCTRRPPDASVLVGSSSAKLAAHLGLRVVDVTELAGSAGTVAVPAASADDLAALGADRGAHLVVGGAWRHLAAVRPTVVSAATLDDVVDAVRVAVAWDAPLGWVDGPAGAARIDPFVVAEHVRTLLAGRAPTPARRARRAAPKNAEPRT